MVVLLILRVIPVALVAAVALAPASPGQLQEVLVQRDKVTTAAVAELIRHHFLRGEGEVQVQPVKTPRTQVTEQVAQA